MFSPALAPWWKDPEAPTAVLVTRATIRQSSHEFTPALADLGKAIERDPASTVARAILVRATVLAVLGHFRESEDDCAKLLGLTQDAYVLVCVAAVEAVTGKARQARAALERGI